jgi:hypothetical protein
VRSQETGDTNDTNGTKPWLAKTPRRTISSPAMTRSTRWLPVLIVLAALPAAAQAPERLRLDYEIAFTGLTVATLDIDVGLGERTYDVNTHIATTGLFAAVYPLTVQARTEGQVSGGRPLAERHRTETRGRSSTRVVEATYRDGWLVAFRRTVDPPERQPESRVPEADRRGSSDPATAILAVVQDVLRGRGCTQRVATFDGRRLHVIRFSDGAGGPPPRSIRQAYGRIVGCSFVYQSTDGVGSATPPRQGRAWIARIRPDAMAPLRIELETRWGTAVVQLRQQPRSLDAGVTPPG